MNPSAKDAKTNDLLGEYAGAARQYIAELKKIDVEAYGYDQLFAHMDEIKELLPPIPKGEDVKQFANYKPARETYNAAYVLVADRIREILTKDLEKGAHDPATSFNYQKSTVPLEAAKRITLFHHVSDKIDLIIAAIGHPDADVKRIGLHEYRTLSTEVRNNTDYFPEPENFKKCVRDLEKILKAK